MDSVKISFNGGAGGIFALPLFPGRQYVFHDSIESGGPAPNVEAFYLQVLDTLSSFRAVFRLTSCTWSFSGQVFPHQWTLTQSHYEGVLDSFQITDRVQDFANKSALQLIVYPNPSSGTLLSTVSLSQPTDIHLHIFNELGKDIMTVYDGMLPEGNHDFSFKLPQGMYYVRMETAEGVVTKKVVVN